jgi:endonuclease YncB( thermonuclease family)
MKAGTGSKRRITAAIAAVGIAATSGIFAYKTLFAKTAYSVARVIDGDTFVTSENQHIRINGVNAPEIDLCGGKESAKTLSDLILRKKVYAKILYIDEYRRELADVYLSDGTLLAEVLAKSGSAYVHQRAGSNPALLAMGNEARKNMRGIYGKTCTQWTNTDKPSCTIKGNNPGTTGNKTYHMPGCQSYAITAVQLYLGDQWFCTEKEAKAAGYTKALSCL